MKQDRKDFWQDRKILWKMADVGKRQFLIDIRNYLFFHRVFKLHREVWSELPAEKTFPLSNSDYWRSEIAVVVMFRDFNGRTWVKDLKSGEYLSGRKARKYK
ncbi:hypothetical protein EDF35_1829 [Rathayibacter sp. PhB151]|nr:hypothetical protein EDF35_1829 [Rathayibacter sp. PhB151]